MFLLGLLNLVYPPVCGFCGKPTKNWENTCTNCISIIQYYQAKIVHPGRGQFFDECISLFPYHGMVRRRILEFKFHHQKYIKYCFAKLMAKHLGKLSICFDVIMPVPISRRRYRERGFNQSKELAKQLSKYLKVPCQNQVLVKTKDNQKQSALTKSKRYENVRGVYTVKNASKMKGKRVLLVDDIFTTGATVNECAKVLKQSGASSVTVITIAYA